MRALESLRALLGEEGGVSWRSAALAFSLQGDEGEVARSYLADHSGLGQAEMAGLEDFSGRVGQLPRGEVTLEVVMEAMGAPLSVREVACDLLLSKVRSWGARSLTVALMQKAFPGLVREGPYDRLMLMEMEALPKATGPSSAVVAHLAFGVMDVGGDRMVVMNNDHRREELFDMARGAARAGQNLGPDARWVLNNPPRDRFLLAEGHDGACVEWDLLQGKSKRARPRAYGLASRSFDLLAWVPTSKEYEAPSLLAKIPPALELALKARSLGGVEGGALLYDAQQALFGRASP